MNIEIGEKIRIERLKKGYNQEKLGKLVSKSTNWIHKVEKGDLRITLDSLDAIANALEVSFYDLLPNKANQFNNCKIINNNCGCFNHINNMNLKIEDIIKLLKENL